MDKVIFANPNAGNALAGTLHDSEYKIITKLAQYDDVIQAISQETHIITAGGDGTANLIINKLYQAKKLDLIKFSILPMGTGNDLARCMGFLHARIEDYHHAEFREKSLHLWCMDQHSADTQQQYIFVNFIGIGIDAQVVFTAERLRSFHNRIYTQVMYVVAALRHLFYRLPKTSDIECDGKKIDCKAGIVLANTNSYAGGCKLGDGSKNFQPELSVFKLHSSYDLIRFVLTRLFKNMVITPNLIAKQATIKGKNLFIEMDGEAIKTNDTLTTINISATNQKLTFWIPTSQ